MGIKKLKEELTYKLIIITNFIGILAGLYFGWLIFESMFAKILLIFIYVIILYYIYKKRLSREKKHAYYLSLFLITATLLFFLVSIKNGDMIVLSLSILFGIVTYNYINQIFNKKGIQYFNAIFIILTIITLDATYPLLKPRIGIENVGPITFGYIINGENYATRDYTFEITPHYLINYKIGNPCTTFYLGEKFGPLYYIQDMYGLATNYFPTEGKVNFCLSKNLTIKSVTILSVSTNRQLNYIVNNRNYNLTNFINVQNFSNLVRHPIVLINNENFPINFQGNFTFTINKKTTYKNNLNLFNDLTKDKSLLRCNLDYFYFNYNISQLYVTPLSGYKVGRDSINITFPLNFNINPLSYNEFNIIYSTDHCVALG